VRLLLTRPVEDSDGLAAELAGIGVTALIEPLLHIEYIDTPPPDLGRFQALLVTSANGVRAFSRVSPDRGIAVYAVGDASARAARDLGFTKVESAAGDVEALAALVRERLNPADGELLHVAASRLAGDLAASLEALGFGYRRAVLYTAEKATRLSDTAKTAIEAAELDGVALYSPRTADSLVGLLRDAGLADKCKHMTAFCLSRAVAEEAGAIAWRDIVVADSPDQAALIETIRAYT
jgi:uroporphyrinogen-III synthase